MHRSLYRPRENSMGSTLPNIQHVIALMFSSWSFDHLLGAMTGVDGVFDAYGNLKPNLYNTMNPLAEAGDGNPATVMTGIVPGVSPDPASQPNYEAQIITNDFNH